MEDSEKDRLFHVATDGKTPFDLVDATRSAIRTIVSSPQFLTFTGKPGPLPGRELVSRLSFFLWKSLPDEQLIELASTGPLTDAKLCRQVDRMLKDERSNRFIDDFLNQWLRLSEIEATTPDEKLYPEYDEILHWSLPQETRTFVKQAIAEDSSVAMLIDSDFLFLNRRLAEHYEIDGVTGQSLRKVVLQENHPRGGLLTQASILKVTANGLLTSPVKRGDFVLTEILGTPPAPPPDNVGSIEPDVSGAETIREQLRRHRDVEQCASCHQEIDPPGFALESFDPIGGFRTHYRKRADDFLTFVAHSDGPQVDCSGETSDGESFEDISRFKSLLMQNKEQVARNFVSQILIYATGGELEFADRALVERILEQHRKADYPMRAMIKDVVTSRAFRNR